jgi:hypothetical protein
MAIIVHSTVRRWNWRPLLFLTVILTIHRRSGDDNLVCCSASSASQSQAGSHDCREGECLI